MCSNWLICSSILAIFFELTLQQPPFLTKFKSMFRCQSKKHTSIQEVYHYEHTLVVANIGDDDELRNCDIIDVYEPHKAQKVLKKLSTVSNIRSIRLTHMMSLMHQCELLEQVQSDYSVIPSRRTSAKSATPKKKTSINSVNMFTGIVPGTKWCGVGNAAENYHDLGQNANIDKCCRRHDLCPVKIRHNDTRFGLINTDNFTKYHCICDRAFYICLKFFDDEVGNLIRRIFFNHHPAFCIDDVPDDKSRYKKNRTFVPRRRFSNTNEKN